MSFPVDCSMIREFKISDNCRGHYSHYCTITLNDGRSKSVAMKHDAINVLIGKIASDRLACGWEKNHFAVTSDLIPEQILSGIFEN